MLEAVVEAVEVKSCLLWRKFEDVSDVETVDDTEVVAGVASVVVCVVNSQLVKLPSSCAL